MYRRNGATQTSYPCLLLGPDAEQQKKTVSDSHVTGPIGDETKKRLQVGVPLWASIWLFLMHVLMGTFFSASCHVYIPYIGETPVWIRSIVLLNSILSGFCDHLGVYKFHPSKLEPFSKVYFPIGLVAFIFYFVNVCTVLHAWQSTAVVFLNVVAIAGPAVAYKKFTGKDPPSNYNEALSSSCTWAGLAAHLATDTAVCILSGMSWIFMGCPPFLA